MEQRLQQLERLREHRADEMGGGTRKDSEEAIARCWLVSVGIDAYRQYPLSSAVADAQAMANYFKDDLKVPSDRINCYSAPLTSPLGKTSSIPYVASLPITTSS